MNSITQVKQNKADDYAGSDHILDSLPPYHYKLLPYGERPYWTLDGKSIVFIAHNYGDAEIMDFETRAVKPLTARFKDGPHAFLRILVLANGDYLLIGPKVFKDRDISRRVESELWVLGKDLKNPPKPLGRRIFEGCGVSTVANRITYAMNGNHDPAIGGPRDFEVHVTEIEYDESGPKLGADKVIYRVHGYAPEPQDFRHNDTEVLMAEYAGNPFNSYDNWRCTVKGIMVDTGKVTVYMDEANVHNECEGVFPDHEHMCLESSCDAKNSFPPIDLWKMKLDGSMQRVRMTQFYKRPPWRTSNSNVSPDGRYLAFMVNRYDSEAGFGMGLGYMDLKAWEESELGGMWETPASRIEKERAQEKA